MSLTTETTVFYRLDKILQTPITTANHTAFRADFRMQHLKPLAASRPFTREPPRNLDIQYCWCLLHLRPLVVWKCLPENEAGAAGRRNKRLPPQFVGDSQRLSESRQRRKRVAAVLHTLEYHDRKWGDCF